MGRKTMRVLAAAMLIGTACWSYGAGIARSTEGLPQTAPTENRWPWDGQSEQQQTGPEP